jgi:hypothetical protein
MPQGTVISKEMKETEMGDRGSKSNIGLQAPAEFALKIFVKEQRVDGSLI